MKRWGVFLVVLLLWASPAYGSSLDVLSEVDNLRESGKWSNNALHQTVIDLVYVESGSVTTCTYEGDAEKLTTNKFKVSPQDIDSAGKRITPYVFELNNQYKPQAYLVVSSIQSDDTVRIYTYGENKNEAMYSVLSGLVECLGNPPVHRDKHSISWTQKHSAEDVTKVPVTSFLITMMSDHSQLEDTNDWTFWNCFICLWLI